MCTVGQLLKRATADLRAANSPSPSLEAQVWLGAVCGLSRASLLAHPEIELEPAEATRFLDGVQRLAGGYPLPYLTGRIEFYGLEFLVTPDTLIPRPETEELVELALEIVAPLERPRIADVGTGSGCIAVALAVQRPAAELEAIDASEAALAIARRNAAAHRVADQIRFRHGHLLEPLSRPVHLIAANLPYVSDAEWDTLPPGVREHEPAAALRGGPDGLRLVDELLQQAPAALLPGGTMLLEIGAAQGTAALDLVRSRLPAAQVELRQDHAGRDRLLLIRAA